jgi:tetratricopeptide (TPR) repeat protein
LDLTADRLSSEWTNFYNTVMRIRRSDILDDQRYPLLLIGGTAEQEQIAFDAVGNLIELDAHTARGLPHQRAASFTGAPVSAGSTLSEEHVFNRGLPITAKALFGREDELDELRSAWSARDTSILTIIGYGGTGKSALINNWLREMRDSDYRGARRVLAWSFYSQGTRENLVSADPFIDFAFSWLGDDSSKYRNPVSRGLELAKLIKQHNFLLILDGVEPLQHPLSTPDVGGLLTDASMRALLMELAEPDWKGLCVVTSRVPLTDLASFTERTQGCSVVQLNLDNLDDEAGVALLRHLLGARASFRELQKAVREVDGHALSINLLGNYLRDVHGGDLAGRYDLEKLTVDVREGGHARRIVESYARWLRQDNRLAELALLQIMGLFDRPATPDAMRALLEDSHLGNLTSVLGGFGSETWNRTVDSLRGMGLLNHEAPGEPGTLDAHPLIREHFREIAERSDNTWLSGNRALFEHYASVAPELPEDSKGMSLLYAAVTHGCAAKRYQEVFDEILLRRVWRSRRTSFSTRRLGMISSDIVALSNFFERRNWARFRGDANLSANAQILIHTNAAVRLRQLGRLFDARMCFGAVLRGIGGVAATGEQYSDASYAAAQYCELLVLAGVLDAGHGDGGSALESARAAIEYADRGDDIYFSMHARSCLGEVYLMLGDGEKAGECFDEARAIDRDSHPIPPFLYSQSLYRYGYFMIESGNAQWLLAEAEISPGWGTNGDDSSLLSSAIKLLVLGAARRAELEAGRRSAAMAQEGEQLLNSAIVAFQTAGYSDYFVRGLLERAQFYSARRGSRDYMLAHADIDKAMSEARRGQMSLLMADSVLQKVNCDLAFWPVMTRPERSAVKENILAAVEEATELVSKMNYGRRRKMLDDFMNSIGDLSS